MRKITDSLSVFIAAIQASARSYFAYVKDNTNWPPYRVKVGNLIAVRLWEPWCHFQSLGIGPFYGIVTDIDESTYETMAIRLNQPLVYDGISARSFVASVRFVGSSLSYDIYMVCSSLQLVSISDDEADAGTNELPISFQERLLMVADISWVGSDLSNRNIQTGRRVDNSP